MKCNLRTFNLRTFWTSGSWSHFNVTNWQMLSAASQDSLYSIPIGRAFSGFLSLLNEMPVMLVLIFTRRKFECGGLLRKTVCSYVLALPLIETFLLHCNMKRQQGKALPYCDQIRPQPYESHLWSKGLQYVRVVSTRLLNACPQLSVGQSTCIEKGS